MKLNISVSNSMGLCIAVIFSCFQREEVFCLWLLGICLGFVPCLEQTLLMIQLYLHSMEIFVTSCLYHFFFLSKLRDRECLVRKWVSYISPPCWVDQTKDVSNIFHWNCTTTKHVEIWAHLMCFLFLARILLWIMPLADVF